VLFQREHIPHSARGTIQFNHERRHSV
jgi:hypothetical protein